MALNVTRSSIRARARKRADMVNDARFSDSDVNDLINVYLPEYYDIIVDAGPPDYYSTDTAIAVVAGTLTYSLPADFYRLVRLYSVETSNRLRPLRELTDVELYSYLAPQSASTLKLRYIPAAPLFTADSGAGGTLDGVSGWDQLIVCWTARAMLQTEESDVSALDAEIAHLTERVRNAARKRSVAGPKFITDAEAADDWRVWQNNVHGYLLRASSIDVYDAAPLGP